MSLNLKDISVNIEGRNLVRDISLVVNPGEVVGLLGPNGAGKTTTFNLAIGQLTPDIGEVTLNEETVTLLPMHLRARMGIGYLPQEPSVFRQLTVSQNIDLALSQCFPNASRRRVRREEIIEEFNLNAFLENRGFQLSGGERRRTEVARAMSLGRMGPKYLLLDEPFAGVDPIAVADLQKLIEKLRNAGMGILITDHNVRETLAITDRAYILSDGQILASGTSAQVSNDPLVRRHYLGEGFKF